MSKVYIFFELTDYALLRFPRWISNQLIDKNSNANLVYIHLYKYDSVQFDIDQLPNQAKIYCLNGRIGRVSSILSKYESSDCHLITMALRPPEFYTVVVAKSLGIRTSLVQHGIFIPFMKRELSYFVDEFKKMVFYFKSIYQVSQVSEVRLMTLVKEIFLIYIKGSRSISDSIFPKLGVLPQQAFVYSEYWKSYFIKQYGFGKEQFELMGSPDLETYPSVSVKERNEAICYICQTLVEDGRLSKSIFLTFINAVAQSIKDDQVLYLKLHPRTEILLYDVLTIRKNTFLVRDSLPNCTKYIGHYSTLLMLPLMLTGDVCLWKFEGHDIPEYFERTASQVINEQSKLEAFIKSREYKLPKEELLNYYFNTPGLKPYEYVSQHI